MQNLVAFVQCGKETAPALSIKERVLPEDGERYVFACGVVVGW